MFQNRLGTTGLEYNFVDGSITGGSTKYSSGKDKKTFNYNKYQIIDEDDIMI